MPNDSPQWRHVFRLARLLLYLLWFGLVTPAIALVDAPHAIVDPRGIDASSLGSPVDLSSTWLVRQGDDVEYGKPKYDDSSWMVVRADGPPLNQVGLRDVDRLWYRTHVHVPPGEHGLALLWINFGGSWDVFVNGINISPAKDFPDGGQLSNQNQSRYEIPDAALEASELTIAVRAAVGRESKYGSVPAGIDPSTIILLGKSPQIAEALSLYMFRTYTVLAALLLLGVVVTLIVTSVTVALPNEKVYVAFWAFNAASLVVLTLIFLEGVGSVPNSLSLMLFSEVMNALQLVAFLEFFRLILGLRAGRIFKSYVFSVIIGIALCNVYLDVNYALGQTGRFSRVASFLVVALGIAAQMVPPAAGLLSWRRARHFDLFVLFFSQFVTNPVFYWDPLVTSLSKNNWSLGKPPISIFNFEWWQFADFVSAFGYLIFIVLRTIRIVGERTRVENEIAAARTMQQVLLARASDPTPGFDVESVYYPADKVGGDFFLVSPGPDGSLTAIVGDVSGKGLVAAMRVAMILGVLRREDSREPCTVLARLNEALLAQGEAGFTTACCVRLERDGRYQIANAGHICPYVDGRELVAPPALPLGIAPSQVYESLLGQLNSWQKLVLMSDGVVEARSAKGELYGFDRLPLLTMKPAREIADTAQRFGQEDDITVLTIAYCAD